MVDSRYWSTAEGLQVKGASQGLKFGPKQAGLGLRQPTERGHHLVICTKANSVGEEYVKYLHSIVGRIQKFCL